MRFMLRFALITALALAMPAAANLLRSGDLRVHYSAVPTTSLAPEVARQYGITRSANRVLLNVAVRRGEPGADEAVAAKVQASATNLAGQRLELRMREVRDGEALYYLGEARVTGQDTLRFDITVGVDGQAPMHVDFSQEFFPQ